MISFKEASLTDVKLIRDLAKISWQSAYQQILSQDQIDYMLAEMYSVREISSQLNHPDYHYFLIFKDDNPVGFLGYENHYDESTTKLHRLYLLPETQGKGVGKDALNFIKKKVSESGDRKIILAVNKNNKARKVYESQGFSVYEDAVVDIGNGFVMDDFLMEYHL